MFSQPIEDVPLVAKFLASERYKKAVRLEFAGFIYHDKAESLQSLGLKLGWPGKREYRRRIVTIMPSWIEGLSS